MRQRTRWIFVGLRRWPGREEKRPSPKSEWRLIYLRDELCSGKLLQMLSFSPFDLPIWNSNSIAGFPHNFSRLPPATQRFLLLTRWYDPHTNTGLSDYLTGSGIALYWVDDLRLSTSFLFLFCFCNPGIFLFLGRYSASKALLFHWRGNMGRTTGFKTIRFLNKVDAILETKTWNSLFPFYSNPELRKVIVFLICRPTWWLR